MASDSHAKRPIVVERRKEKGRKKTPRLTKTYDVKIIPATVGVVAETEEPPKKRVAAYCRVSTDQEAQETSLEEQMAHFNTVIAEHPDWELAGIYADEGISGTQVKHRVQFQQMIEDAKAKKIDLILTKSISRFARNVVDCLTNIRLLRNLRPPVSVYFDKERLDSLDEKAEVFLTMLASFAQEESRSISTNIKWATRSRMKAGTQKISTTSLLGYDTDDDGEMVIVTNEAEIVRTIYMSFDKGMHPAEIAEKLNALEIRTIKNNPWTGESVKNILRNEKYCGDVLMQKTYTVDCLTHKTKKNEGEVEQYFIPDHHPAIVEREIWDKAQVRLEQIAGKRRRIRPKQQRLVPLRKGVLLGFVPIRPTWKAVSFKRLETATEKVMALVDAKPEQVHIEYESEECEMEILKGYDDLSSDGVHPNDAGQEIYFETVKAVIDDNVAASTGKMKDTDVINADVHKFDNFVWYDASSDFEQVDDTTFTISTSASGILGIDYTYESGDNKADIYVDGELFESPTVTFDYDFSQRHILVVSDDCTVKNEIKVVFTSKEQADGFKGMCFSWE